MIFFLARRIQMEGKLLALWSQRAATGGAVGLRSCSVQWAALSASATSGGTTQIQVALLLTNECVAFIFFW